MKMHLVFIFLLISNLTFGQVRVTDINSNGSSSPSNLRAINDKLYFAASTTQTGNEPYVLNADGNYVFIGDLRPGSDGASPLAFTEFQGDTYFLAATSPTNTELYKYDNNGILSIVNAVGANKEYRTEKMDKLTIFDNKLIVSLNANNFNFGSEPYVYDNLSGLNLLADINPGALQSFPASFTEMNGKLYFGAITQSFGEELWVYDPLTMTVSMVADLNSGTGSSLESFGSSPTSRFYVFKDKLYFSADNGTDGPQLYEYDGINFPTPIIINSSGGSYPWSFYELNNTLFFSARDSTNTASMYSFDGTNTPIFFSDVRVTNAVYFKDELLFVNNTIANGYELWKFDGVNQPVMVNDLNSGAGSALGFSSFVVNDMYEVVNDTFYFVADDGIHGRELWKYDGSHPPTLVADIFPGPDGSSPSHLVNYNETLYFAADDGVFGKEIWYLEKAFTPASPIQISDNSIQLFPNPTSQSFRLETEAQIQKITIYTIIGKEVLSVFGDCNEVDISHLPAGVYIVSVETSEGQLRKSVVKN